MHYSVKRITAPRPFFSAALLTVATPLVQVVEYWEAVLKRLKVFKAQARLRHIHAQLLKEHLARLQAPTREERDGARAVLAGTGPLVEREGTPEDDIYQEDPVSYSPEPSPEPEAERAEGVRAVEEAPAEDVIEYDGALSPEPYRPAADEVVVDAEADQLEQVGGVNALQEERFWRPVVCFCGRAMAAQRLGKWGW